MEFILGIICAILLLLGSFFLDRKWKSAPPIVHKVVMALLGGFIVLVIFTDKISIAKQKFTAILFALLLIIAINIKVNLKD